MVTTPDRSYDICVDGVCVSPGCGDATCNAPGPHFTLPDTNQRKCYDGSAEMICPASGEDWYGQDAQYGWDMSNPSNTRFTRNTAETGEPMVTDNVTDLVWQGCADGLTGDNCETGSAAEIDWDAALVYCDSLSWGGYSDWRLPDKYEMDSITDLGVYNPSIDSTAFPATPSDYFWSSSSDASDTSRAWLVNFDYGYVYNYASAKTFNNYHARCVRSGPATVANIFTRDTTATDNPVVTDNVTDLMWQGCAGGLTGDDCATGSASDFTWQEALAYCEGLDWGGSSDWYLPNKKELLSIVDDREYDPAINSTAFPATPSDAFWSPSSYANGTSLAWGMHFFHGNVGFNDKTNGYHARCVRSGP